MDFLTLSGSRALGTHTEHSDWDLVGFGRVGGFGPRATDCRYIPFDQFVRGCESIIPALFESLFVPSHNNLYVSDFASEFLRTKRKYLTKQTAGRLAFMAHANLKMERNSKRAYFITRMFLLSHQVDKDRNIDYLPILGILRWVRSVPCQESYRFIELELCDA